MLENFLVLRRSDGVFLCSVLNSDKDHRATCLRVSQRITPSSTRMSLMVNDVSVVYLASDEGDTSGLVFFVVNSGESDRQATFRLLDELSAAFIRMYPPTAEPIASLTPDGVADFRTAAMDRLCVVAGASHPLGGDLRLHYVSRDVSELRDTMADNLDRALRRGDRLGDVAELSERLDASAQSFATRATALRRQAWWQSARIYVVCAIGALVVLIAMVVWVAQKRSGSSSSR
eukprot:TRINITY_DN17612_c0_g1_i1.p1 TRINITY_DN17612_c0_g1~~TRINITY_DN17612_c0_g1_i1.p1  ORF type:complete len:265 (-),score=20.26 TRINITY_DN17612_c0_g1_i1:143-838(-)